MDVWSMAMAMSGVSTIVVNVSAMAMSGIMLATIVVNVSQQ
jgi:hypothetical protein